MARINENIRFYTEQDPYYFEVDNLPLQDLLNNDKTLQVQIDDIINGDNVAAVSRRNIDELRPYLGKARVGALDYQAVFVKPGRFTARINTPSEVKNGSFEVDPTASGNVSNSVDAVNNLNSQVKSQSVSGVGRTAIVELRKRIDDQDQYITIAPFDPTEWDDNNPNNIARIDVVYVRAYPAVDQNGNSLASAPSVGILKGAGIVQGSNASLLSNQKSRVTDSLGTRAHMRADADDNEGSGFTLSSGEVQSVGSIPIPEDLLNSFESRIIQAEGGESYNAFFLPVAYIVVPSSYRSNIDSIDDENICDIRPFFRTNELTFNERQAIIFTEQRPSIENPFATKLSVQDAIGKIKLPEPKPGEPGAPGNPLDAGAMMIGMGIIRGGKVYGPERYYPEASTWYPSWDGSTDWDLLPAAYKSNEGNLRPSSQATAPYGADAYIWHMKNMLCSKKTIGVALPSEFNYYYVDAEYMYSVPLPKEGSRNTTWNKYPISETNFVVPGLSVHVTPNAFTVVTKSFSHFLGYGSERTELGMQGAYSLMLNENGDPYYYEGTSRGVVSDPKWDKSISYNSNWVDGVVHLLPTVIYKVYGVKSGYLTTGSSLKTII